MMKRMRMIFVFFVIVLFDNAYDMFNQVYILLKHSVVASDVSSIVFYGIELAAIIVIVVSLFKFVRNVERKIIFDYKNVRLLQVIGLTLIAPPMLDMLGRIIGFYEETVLAGDFKIWLAGTFFVIIISEVFKKGIEQKEELDNVV